MTTRHAGLFQALRDGHRESPARGTGWLPMLAVAALAVAANLPALHNGFVWDDSMMVREGVLENLEGLAHIWLEPGRIRSEGHYWPLTWTTFWIDHQLHDQWAPGWHATNLVLHALVSVLVGRTLEGLGVRGAWIAAAVFAVHPVHAEVAAWTIARKDALAALLALAAVNRWLKDDRAQRVGIWPSVLIALALLAKSSAVVAVPILAVTLWWQKGWIGWSEIRRLAPLALVAGAIVTWDVLRYVEIDTYRFGHDLATRLGSAGWTLAHQTGALAWPVDLTPMRGPYAGAARNPAGWGVIAGFGLALATLVALRQRIGRGPGAALACFVIGLGPTLGLVEFSFLRFSASADRFAYIASIAPIALAGAGVALGIERARARWGAGAGIAGWGALASVLAILAGISLAQGGVYRDNIRFFTEVRERMPRNAAMTFNHAKALADEGRYEESTAVSREGIRHHPKNPRLAHQVGETLRKLGRHREAEAAYRRAIALNPGRAWTHVGLGYALLKQGRRAEAAGSFMAAGKRSTRLRGAIAATLAKTQLELGQPREAIRTYREGVGLRPNDPVLHANLGAVLVATGREKEARPHLERALVLAPNLDLARDLLRKLDGDERPDGTPN